MVKGAVIEKQEVGEVVIEEVEVEESMVIEGAETMIGVEVEIVREVVETVIEEARRLEIKVEEVVIEGVEVVKEVVTGEGEGGIMNLGEVREARGRRKGRRHR